jgi:parallel beta-helix repeat protein
MRKLLLAFALALLSATAIAGFIRPVSAEDTVLIKSDGSVEPVTAPIQRDGDVYTFTGNIYDSIVVERDNIVVDGAGFTLQGVGSGTGIDVESRNNVTIENVNINTFNVGIHVSYSTDITVSDNGITNNTCGISLSGYSNNTISGNTIANNAHGIYLGGYSNNTVFGNTVTNNGLGIYLVNSSNNTISGNTVTKNEQGIHLTSHADDNTVSGNVIAGNGDGIYFYYSTSNDVYENVIVDNACGVKLGWISDSNVFFHNDFANNTQQVIIDRYVWGANDNIWDASFPSGGNYWSDYLTLYPNATEIDSSGIGDTPYTIDYNNQDRYPLAEPYIIPEFPNTLLLTITLTTITLTALLLRQKTKNHSPKPLAPQS